MILDGKHSAKIDLPPSNLIVLEKPCKIAGWGFTEQGFEAKYLQKTMSRQRRKDRNTRSCRKARENKAFCSRGNFVRKMDVTKAWFPIAYQLIT